MKVTTLRQIEDLATAMVKSAVENGQEFDLSRTTKTLLMILENPAIYSDVVYDNEGNLLGYLIAVRQENPFNGKIQVQEMTSEFPEAHKQAMLEGLEAWAKEQQAEKIIIITKAGEKLSGYIADQTIHVKTQGGG